MPLSNAKRKLIANLWRVIYAGYFFGQYPCGYLVGRFPAQKVIAVSILLWGVMVLVMTQCYTFSGACRLLHRAGTAYWYAALLTICQWRCGVGLRF